MAWTSTYAASLEPRQVAHFFRRTSFGVSPRQLRTYSGRTAQSLFDELSGVASPSPPTDPSGKTFHDLAYGAPETDPMQQGNLNNQRMVLLKQWWLGLMLDPLCGFSEKLVLFWQNHFVVESDAIQDVRFLYSYMDTLRRNALGSFRNFLIEITKDPSMLIYLNGNENVTGQPNENYARELLELFSLGRGNFSEEDVKEASRALTGWRVINFRNSRNAGIGSQFLAGLHDTADKSFSGNFQKKSIAGHSGSNAGEEELASLIDMILAHPESARFMVRKLYRWYFTAEISLETEKNFIEPLAVEFRKDYQLLPLLRRMLTSDHFFDEGIRGAQIRSPIDIIMATMLGLDAYYPNRETDRSMYDLTTNNLLRRSRLMEMEVIAQPSVFGWRPYYDTGFYKLWISGTTLGLRGDLTDSLVQSMPNQGLRTNVVDWITFVSDPSDPLLLVREVWNLFMAVDPTQEQLDELVDGPLLDGIPRYEWTGIWNTYTANKSDNDAYNNVRQRLTSLLSYMLRLAEYQLG